MSLKFVLKSQDEDAYWRAWQKCADTLAAGPRYTKLNVEWCLGISGMRGNLLEDKSFVGLRDGKPVVVAVLPVEKGVYGPQMTMNGSYIYGPLIVDRDLRKEVFLKIEDLAEESNASKTMFSIEPFAASPYNYLQQYGYLDSSILTYMIDLGTSVDLLHACRRGHKCDIKKMMNNEKVEVLTYNSTNASYEAHEAYRLLHKKCSGRETRPKETFDKQFEMLKSGEAVLFGLEYEGRAVVYAYFQYANGICMYSSGADDPDYSALPLYHTVIYKAMEYFKHLGVRYIDTGQPSSASVQFDYLPDAKQLNIAKFKRGFPGDFSSLYRGIKFYSKEAFIGDFSAFAKGYESKIGFETSYHSSLQLQTN